jgi:hypothetical protein
MEIYPLSYSIPDECIVNSIPQKTQLIAQTNPLDHSSYIFNESQETDYYESYKSAKYAITTKKGGWDCLRHYEILANGCLPLFFDINKCSPHKLTSLPKDLLTSYEYMQTYAMQTVDHPLAEKNYNILANRCLEWTKTNCSCSKSAKYVLTKQDSPDKIKNILLIRCDQGVNYTRELLWIGLKRHIQSISGIAVEYPKIPYLYDTFDPEDAKRLHGKGFTYTRRLKDDYCFSDQEIIDKIKTGFWDMVIFGKVGPDELAEGSIPNLPLWETVYQNVDKSKIIFLYGGDECIDLTYPNRYRNHIEYHRQFGKCFVRELHK